VLGDPGRTNPSLAAWRNIHHAIDLACGWGDAIDLLLIWFRGVEIAPHRGGFRRARGPSLFLTITLVNMQNYGSLYGRNFTGGFEKWGGGRVKIAPGCK